MRSFIIGNEPNLAAVVDAVLKTRSKQALREAALASIRRANPTLDEDDLPAGSVVLIPTLEGGRPGLAKDDPLHVAADQILADAREGIASLRAAEENAEAQRSAEKTEAQELFETTAVKRLAEQMEALEANIASVQQTHEEDDAVARQQAKDFDAAADGWASDLETLRALLDT